MTSIDAAVLDLTEWLCRKFQLMTGRTNVWLAVQFTNLSIIVYFVWAFVYFWTSDLSLRIAVALFCSGLLYVLTQTIFKESIETYEKNAYHRVAKGLRNPRRVRDASLRISFLTLSIVLFYPILFVHLNLRSYLHLRVHIALLSYSLIVLTTAVLYLLACDPLPPCAGKVREWLRGLAPSRVVASESTGGRGEMTALRHDRDELRRWADEFRRKTSSTGRTESINHRGRRPRVRPRRAIALVRMSVFLSDRERERRSGNEPG